MLHLNTIGPLSINVGSSRVTARSPLPCATLLYLIAERGQEVSRRALVELLYPESTEEAGSHSLRQLLYRLREKGVPLDHGAPVLMLGRELATWDVEQIDSGASFTDEQLDGLAQGYLSDFPAEFSPAFGDWLEEHRSKTTKALRRRLLGDLRAHKERHDFRSVDRFARACLALDPLNEEATLATAESLVMSGSKTEALAVLDRYIDDVGVRSPDLQFAPKLLRERISEYVADRGGLVEPPLVGREGEMAMLRGLLSRIKAGLSEGYIVWGQSGIGKTRLLEEASAIAALEGIAVVRCSLQPHDQRRPLAILRDLAPGLLDLRGSIGCSPKSLGLMRGISGRSEMPPLDTPRNSYESEVALASVISSTTDLLDAVCCEAAVLLCVEEGHWLDAASIELLVEAIGGQRAIGLIIASQRTIQLPQGLANAGRLHSIHVSSLDRSEATSLVHSLFNRAHRTVDAAMVEWAVDLADGVPFYLKSLFVEYSNTGGRTAIPATLRASLASKLERIAEPTRSVFDAIVVLAKLCTVGRLEALVQLPRYALLNSLRELEERGLTRAARNSVTYAHELFAATAREKMPASVSSSLHRACAELLDSQLADPNVTPWDIADHWAQSGDASRALSIMLMCAHQALLLGRAQDALSLLDRCSSLPGSTEEQRRYLTMALQASRACSEFKRATQFASELLAINAGDGDPPNPRLWVDWIDSAYNMGLSVTAHRDELLAIARNAETDKQIRVRALNCLLFIAEDTNDEELASGGLACVDDLTADECLGPRMIFETVFGDLNRAKEFARLIIAQTNSSSVPYRFLALHPPAFALWRSGDLEGARGLLASLYRESEQARLWTGCASVAAKLAELHWQADNLEEARKWHHRCAENVARTNRSNVAACHYGMRMQLALYDGRPDLARNALTEIKQLCPNVLENRRAVETLAYEIRIDLADGIPPSTASINDLLEGHCRFRGLGMADFVADSVLMALRRTGRYAEARRIRAEYLTRFRREIIPPSKELKELNPDSRSTELLADVPT